MTEGLPELEGTAYDGYGEEVDQVLLLHPLPLLLLLLLLLLPLLLLLLLLCSS